MNLHTLDAYDYEQLQKAKLILEKIYTYHYGDSYMASEIKRLETIISKIEFLESRCRR